MPGRGELAHHELVKHKNEFLSSISHELRTPLTAVIGFSGLLADPDPVLDQQARNGPLRTLTEQTWDLAGIVDDLLTVARKEIGELQVVDVRADLPANIRQVVESYGDRGRSIHPATNDQAIASGDPGRIRQIIRNLVTNALKYGRDPIRIEANIGSDRAHVLVIDHGDGIPNHLINSMFARFGSGRPSETKPQSVGIGLWLSRELAEMMAGTLQYRRDGDQTIFDLALPLRVAP